jgi:hypothetical protein
MAPFITGAVIRDKLAIVKARRPATKTPYLQGSERKAGEIKAIARIGLKSSTFAILIHMAYEHFFERWRPHSPALSDSLKGQLQKADGLMPALMKLGLSRIRISIRVRPILLSIIPSGGELPVCS